MENKKILLACFLAACLLGWADTLPARNVSGQKYNSPENAAPQDTADPDNSGEDGQDDKGKVGPGSDENDNVEGEGNASEGGENDESGGNGERATGDGNGGGGGRGGYRPAAKKVSYKDSVTLAAKYTAQKQYAAASRQYNKALTVLSDDDSRKIFVYERQGWLALKANDISGAESLYLAAIYQAEKIETFDKNAVNAYRGAAYCYEKDGEISSAVENYKLALKHATDKAAKADIRKKLQRLQAGKNKKAR